MGWNSWNQVGCDGLNEKVVKQAADALVKRGLAKAGYDYVVVDDCWQAPKRNAAGDLVADPKRFPSGMKALADYVHGKGLKFGMYLVPGSKTCGMIWNHYPATGLGSDGHERQDAAMLKRVGVDYLKYDWCSADTNDGLKQQAAFTLMRDELKRLHRPIVYSISDYGESKPWTWAPKVANLWRTTKDIAPNWPSIRGIIDAQAPLAAYAGPGHWNDPDMLQIGNGGLTLEEAKSHFGMWSMLAAPLMLGTNLDTLSPDLLKVVSNNEVIAIDQDPLGRQARRVETDTSDVWNPTEVWVRPLAGGDFAVALFNEGTTPRTIATTLGSLKIPAGTWKVRNASDHTNLPATDGPISGEVPPHGLKILRLSKS